MKQVKIYRELLLTGVLMIATIVIHAQRVGIRTSNPQATLHVAGTLRVDTATTVLSTKKIMTMDSSGMVHTLSFDSLKQQITSGLSGGGSGVVLYQQEENALTSTTSNIPQVRVTLTLPPGTYLMVGYFEAYNSNIDAGVRATFREGVGELAYGIVWSNSSTFGTWSATRIVSPTVPTDYTLLWSSWPGGTTSHIRRARILALKIL